MKYDEFLNEVARQIKFNLPDDLFFITLKESKTSQYFYIGNERQLDDYSNGIELDEDTFIKFRISDHHAVCARSYADESVILTCDLSGYYCDAFDADGLNDQEIAKKIAEFFTRKF